jgi:hypothetical protein
VLSHDATFKPLFSLIGQTKMAQEHGEAHALHTFLGKSGAFPGASLQRTEGDQCFRDASSDVLPESARATTKYIFSDSPASIQATAEVYPNLECVAEDAIHLVFRVEACFGEKRNKVSSYAMALQMKFRAPLGGAFYEGRELAHGEVGAWVEEPLAMQPRSDGYFSEPYLNHQQYVDDLQSIATSFPLEMPRKNSKGATLYEILKAAASYHHYGYLQNGSVVLGRLSSSDRALLAWGTCGNEALHKQIKCAFETVTQQHEARMVAKMSAFSLANLLAHVSAAYNPTLVQRTQSELRCVIEGSIARSFFPVEDYVAAAVVSREAGRAHAVGLDRDRVERRSRMLATRSASWAKQVAIDAEKRHRAPRATKRTVYTQAKTKKQRAMRSGSAGKC